MVEQIIIVIDIRTKSANKISTMQKPIRNVYVLFPFFFLTAVSKRIVNDLQIITR